VRLIGWCIEDILIFRIIFAQCINNKTAIISKSRIVFEKTFGFESDEHSAIYQENKYPALRLFATNLITHHVESAAFIAFIS
jgi:hypothetical protein